MKKHFTLLLFMLCSLWAMADDKIYYTSFYGNVVYPCSTSAFDATIISNTYENGTGVITFDDDLTSIGEQAFRGCSGLTSVTIPNSVTSIGSKAFYYCSGLTSVTIPNSVTSIGSSAFYNCSGLKSVVLPSLTSIGNYAFQDCNNIEDIYAGKAFAIPKDVFSCQKWATVHVLEKFIPIFKDTDGWRAFYLFEPYTEPAPVYKKADVNEDGVVNAADVVSIYNAIINGE